MLRRPGRRSAPTLPKTEMRPFAGIWLELNARLAHLQFVTGYLLLVPINFLVSGVLTFCLNWLTAIPWRKASTAHWTERARLLWPVRRSGATIILVIPACLSVAEVAAQWESWSGSVFPAVAGLLGAILATFPLDREIFPRFTFRSWLRLVSVGWTIRLGFWAVFVASAMAMPDELGVTTAVIGGAVLLFILAWNFGLLLRFFRWLGMVRAPDERLRGIVAGTAGKMAVGEPGTWLLDVPFAQAFAITTTGDLLFSSRLLEILSDGKISAVCAHELAHLMESKVVLAGRIAGSLTLYPLIFLRPAANFGPSAVCAILGFIWLSAILVRKLSRRMEKRADEIASENQGEEGVYARALEKLYCDSLLPAVSASNVKTHPHLYDRMVASGIQPEYPRPAKPEGMAWAGYLVCIALGILIGIALAN
ncbi:MAG: M48 family metalloprotease [Verrucomicrobiota bacterium]